MPVVDDAAHEDAKAAAPVSKIDGAEWSAKPTHAKYSSTTSRSAEVGNEDGDEESFRLAKAKKRRVERYNECVQLIYEDDFQRMIELLVEDGDSIINYKDEAGQSLLHVAAFWGKAKIAANLLLLRCEVEPKNAEGLTPLEIAIEWDHFETAQVIRSAGGFCSMEERIKELEKNNRELSKKLEKEIREKELVIEELKCREEECDSRKRSSQTLRIELKNLRGKLENTQEALATEEKARQRAELIGESLRRERDSARKKIADLRSKIVVMAERLKSVLLERVQLIRVRAKLKKMLAKKIDKLKMYKQKIELERQKFRATACKLVLCSRKLVAQRTESERLKGVEKHCRALKRKLETRRATTVLETLSSLCPPSIMAGALRTLQQLAHVGENLLPQHRQYKPRRKNIIERRTAYKKVIYPRAENSSPMPTDKESNEGRRTAKQSRNVEFSHTLGGIQLPYCLLTISSGGVSFVSVEKAVYDPETKKETLIVSDMIPFDEVVRRETAPSREKFSSMKEHQESCDSKDEFAAISKLSIPSKSGFKQASDDEILSLAGARPRPCQKTQTSTDSSSSELPFIEFVKGLDINATDIAGNTAPGKIKIRKKYLPF